MKIYVVNVFYDEQVKDETQQTKFIRIDEETGEEVEIPNEAIILRKCGTVILMAESSDKVFNLLRERVTDQIIEVEIVDEIDIEEVQAEQVHQTKTMNLMGYEDGGVEEQPVPGKIIFQSNI